LESPWKLVYGTPFTSHAYASAAVPKVGRPVAREIGTMSTAADSKECCGRCDLGVADLRPRGLWTRAAAPGSLPPPEHHALGEVSESKDSPEQKGVLPARTNPGEPQQETAAVHTVAARHRSGVTSPGRSTRAYSRGNRVGKEDGGGIPDHWRVEVLSPTPSEAAAAPQEKIEGRTVRRSEWRSLRRAHAGLPRAPSSSRMPAAISSGYSGPQCGVDGGLEVTGSECPGNVEIREPVDIHLPGR